MEGGGEGGRAWGFRSGWAVWSEDGGRFWWGEASREPSRSYAKLAKLLWVRFHRTCKGSEWKRMNCVGKGEAGKVF